MFNHILIPPVALYKTCGVIDKNTTRQTFSTAQVLFMECYAIFGFAVWPFLHNAFVRGCLEEENYHLSWHVILLKQQFLLEWHLKEPVTNLHCHHTD